MNLRFMERPSLTKAARFGKLRDAPAAFCLDDPALVVDFILKNNLGQSGANR
jgi:hypothetical protein